MGGLITALRTLTIFPVPGKESRDFSASLFWFPLVGLFLGLVLFVAAVIWTRVLTAPWAGGGAMMILVISIVATRGLHLDGLADWADAMGGRPARERRLTIMKEVHLGAFGVLALIIAVAGKFVALERLIELDRFVFIPFVLIVSRGMMVELMATLPYARSSEGTAGPFVQGASLKRRWITLLFTFGLCAFFWPWGPVMFFMGWGVTAVFRRHCRKRFGGVTGDLIGALNEIIEITLLFLSALPGEGFVWYRSWSWLAA